MTKKVKPKVEEVEKDYQVRVLAYVLERTWVKAKTPEEAKRKISDQLIQDKYGGGYSAGLVLQARQINWLHEKYPIDLGKGCWRIATKIGYEPVTKWE